MVPCRLEHATVAKIHAKNLGGVELQKDPVCGMMVDEKKTKLTSKHGDSTFYFCSASCKTTFDKDSHRYGHQ
jgi:YHS domain-containing protein